MIKRQEAKDKCIAMWEHIAKNIEDEAWRAEVDDELPLVSAIVKRVAILELYPGDDPEAACYLCSSGVSCTECPLDHCLDRTSPYTAFRVALRNYHYPHAAAAARRLVEKVKAWKVTS